MAQKIVSQPAPRTRRPRVRPVTPLESERRRRGLTQADAAGRCGISRSYWGLIENGLRPTVRVRGAIAAILEVSPEELWRS